MWRRGHDEAGAVAVLFAICAAVLFLLCALVVDLGLARDTRRQSQNAADASALAAANAMYPSGSCSSPVGAMPPCLLDAVAAAKSYAQVNFGVTSAQWSTCPAPPSGFVAPDLSAKCISVDSLLKPTKVWMVMPTHSVETTFGNAANVSEIPIGSQARARISDGAAQGCGLCFLGPVDAINADFTVEGGGIFVNGDLDAGPNSVWQGTSISVAGSVSGGQFYPPYVGGSSITDPWASKAGIPPSLVGLGQKADPCAGSGKKGGATPGDGPGVYADVAIPNSACQLEPGLYVITGTWSMKNNSDLVGTDVTLYFTCGTLGIARPCVGSESGGQLAAKNGEVHLSAPISGPRAGLAIVYDRHNNSPLQLQGNGDTSISGAVYAPISKLDFNGNSCFVFRYGPVIAQGVIKANGNKSCVTVKDSTDADLPETARRGRPRPVRARDSPDEADHRGSDVVAVVGGRCLLVVGQGSPC